MNTRTKSLFSVIFLTGLLLSIAGAQSAAQEAAEKTGANPSGSGAQNVEFVGHIGGTTDAVAVAGNYAFIGEGPALTILDISDPGIPTVLGKTAIFPDFVHGVAVSGGYAYVADGIAGLRVVERIGLLACGW